MEKEAPPLQPGEDNIEQAPVVENANNVSKQPDLRAKNSGTFNIEMAGNSDKPVKLIFQVDQEHVPFARSVDSKTECFVETVPLQSTSASERLVTGDEENLISFDTAKEGLNVNNKRPRNPSGDEDDVVLPPNKAIKTNKKTHRITFIIPPPLQNNGGEKAVNEQLDPKDGIDAPAPAPGPAAPRERVNILPAAEPMWQAARRHRGSEQKAKLRADHHAQLLEQDIIPSQFLGSDKIARYFIKEGKLPSPMQELILQPRKN